MTSSLVYASTWKPFGDQHLRRLERRDDVGQQRALVADDLQLHPVAHARRPAQPRVADRLLGRVAAGRVRQQEEPLRVEVVEDALLLRAVQVHAPHGDRHHLGARRLDGAHHLLVRAVLARADDQPRAELAPAMTRRVQLTAASGTVHRLDCSSAPHEMDQLHVVALGSPSLSSTPCGRGSPGCAPPRPGADAGPSDVSSPPSVVPGARLPRFSPFTVTVIILLLCGPRAARFRPRGAAHVRRRRGRGIVRVPDPPEHGHAVRAGLRDGATRSGVMPPMASTGTFARRAPAASSVRACTLPPGVRRRLPDGTQPGRNPLRRPPACERLQRVVRGIADARARAEQPAGVGNGSDAAPSCTPFARMAMAMSMRSFTSSHAPLAAQPPRPGARRYSVAARRGVAAQVQRAPRGPRLRTRLGRHRREDGSARTSSSVTGAGAAAASDEAVPRSTPRPRTHSAWSCGACRPA
jgi:hypothetical protein